MDEYISCDMTDFPQDEDDIALASPADLETVLRECEKEPVFSMRPKVEEVSMITTALTNNPTKPFNCC